MKVHHKVQAEPGRPGKDQSAKEQAPFGMAGLMLDPRLAELMTDVDEFLRAAVRSDFTPVTEAALHLIEAGGKRLRPLLVLLAAQCGPNPDRDAAIKAAVSVELVHLASLYHDDVIDEAAIRRGRSAANAKWGNTVAILTGDYLFSRSSSLASELGITAVKLLSNTFTELVTGQMRETVGPRKAEDPVQHYMTIIKEKTASLIATATELGALCTDISAEQTQALRKHGQALGIAFQIADDIADIALPASVSGKTPGTDLREGVKTLPMLYVLTDDPTSQLAAVLNKPALSEAEVQWALKELGNSAALRKAQNTLAEYGARAITELDAIPDSSAKRALVGIVDYVVNQVIPVN